MMMEKARHTNSGINSTNLINPLSLLKSIEIKGFSSSKMEKEHGTKV